MGVPVIHGYFSSDFDPIDKWIPNDVSRVSIFIDVYLGPDIKPSGEYFTINVVTNKMFECGVTVNKYQCVLDQYDWDSVKKWVGEVTAKCDGNNWAEMADKLSHFMLWEFQSYSNHTRSS